MTQTNSKQFHFRRFHEAQEAQFADAFSEIKNGQKKSHWMWFIFPQLEGLGNSPKAKFYALKNLNHAEAYLDDSVLNQRLLKICKALLLHPHKTAFQIFDSPDYLKLKSSMTLFSQCKNGNEIFKKVLDQFFEGEYCGLTLEKLGSGKIG